MTALFYYLLKVIFCSGILYGYYHLALRNKIFHAWNRFYLLAMIPVSILLPLLNLHIIAPAESPSKILTAVKIVAEADDHMFNEKMGSGMHISAEIMMALAYGIISILILAVFIRGLVKIAAMIKKYNQVNLGEILFLNTREQGTPFSFFKYLFWNEEISPESENGKRIMEHELVHIREKHSWDKIFIHLSLVFFWSNPFFWLARKELAMIHEFIADRKTIGDGDVKAFAKLILEASFPEHSSLLTNSFFQSSIKRRISMITKKHQQFSYLSRLMMIPVLFILVFTFGVKANDMLNEGHTTLKLEKKYTVVIDAGHGGTDAGAEGGSLKEKDLALAMALAVKSLSNNPNINIILSRSTDILQPVKDKTLFAEQTKADLFVSLHVNSAVSRDSSGFVTYISARNTANREQNVRLASLILSNLATVYKTQGNIRQREQQGVWVLDNNKCPAALIECGYISNDKDRAFIANSDNQKKIAEKILRSIEEYFSENVQVNTSTVQPSISMIRMDTVAPGKKKSSDIIRIQADTLVLRGDTTGIPSTTTYSINGQPVSSEIVSSIDPNKIESVNVTKKDGKGNIDIILKKTNVVTVVGQPLSKKDQEALNSKTTVNGQPLNVKEITVVGHPLSQKEIEAANAKTANDPNKEITVKGYKISPLYLVDGKEMSDVEAEKIDPNKISEVNVLKGEAAKAKYGDKGKYGVIEIKLKK